ncbi:hypothetical protein [Paenibacillus pini]|uniref:DUF2577 domain-containing protein n=1 Tax=Paenibacillus pini JCM 16418 TaxID=1236976 RepID=W7Z086_9BACL|nr:hypothetical protein [Paenibacillus pini]GAF08029.1 hypothetical protein JCM16418_2066 [Paenibacillus pini JCM 16418]
MSKDPYGHFADVMRTSMSNQTRQALNGVGAVLGTITGTGLKLDDFKHELQDYLIAELPGTLSISSKTVKETTPIRDGEEVLLELKKGLKPGDRVLAMRVNSGNDVVVVCKVVSGHA